MMNMFALGLEETITPREGLFRQRGLARLGYADDLHFYGPVPGLLESWPVIVQAMADAGLEVQPTKSKFWSPTADKRERAQLPIQPEVGQLAALIKRSKNGIDLLGGAAASEHDVSTFVTTQRAQVLRHHTDARKDKATFYASRLRELVTSQVSATITHKTWLIASKSAAKAFSYDAALAPRSDLEPAVKPVAEILADIADKCVLGLAQGGLWLQVYYGNG